METSSFVTDILPIAVSFLTGLGGWLGAFIYFRFQKADERKTSEKLREAADRLTTTDWLKRETERDQQWTAEVRALRDEVSRTREMYEKRLEDKNKQLEAQESRHVAEKDALNARIDELQEEVSELRHQVNNQEHTKGLGG